MSLHKTVTAAHEKLKKSGNKVKSMTVEADEGGKHYIVTHNNDMYPSPKHVVKPSKLSAHCAQHMSMKKGGDSDE